MLFVLVSKAITIIKIKTIENKKVKIGKIKKNVFRTGKIIIPSKMG